LPSNIRCAESFNIFINLFTDFLSNIYF
jgi:hypothetical protein